MLVPRKVFQSTVWSIEATEMMESKMDLPSSQTAKTQPTLTVHSLLAGGYCGFHRGKPVPFTNRAPSWIFEARAPGYERVSAKIERGGGGGKEKPSFPLFAPHAPLPRVTILSTTARPASPRRVLSKMAATKILAEEKLQRLQVG